MKKYRKYVQVRSFGYDDFSSGKVVLDWTPEEEADIENVCYEYEKRVYEKFVEIKEN